MNNLNQYLDFLQTEVNVLNKKIEQVKHYVDKQNQEQQIQQQKYNQQLKQLQNKRPNGIVINYKTFSDIVNALQVSTQYGVIDAGFVDYIINIGNEQMKQNDFKQQENESIQEQNLPIDIQNLMYKLFSQKNQGMSNGSHG